MSSRRRYLSVEPSLLEPVTHHLSTPNYIGIMKQKGMAVTLALLVAPISSWEIEPKKEASVWSPRGLVAGGKSGERCGVYAHGVACEEGLCCSDWGFCGKGPLYCAVHICQPRYGSCDTAGEVPKDDFLEEKPLREDETLSDIKTETSSRPVVDQIELAPEEAEDLQPLEVETDQTFWDDNNNADFSWDKEIPSWEQDSRSQFSRQDNGRPKFGSLPYGVEISSCLRSNTIALTFDDGPNAYLTGELLDLFDERDVKATFFVNGDNSGLITDPAKSERITRMLASGHHVASHGWSHLNLDVIPIETKRSEIKLLEDALAGIMGGIPTYFRPPFGSCDGECLGLLAEYGYHTIRWDVDTNDWRGNLQSSMDAITSAFASMDSANVLAHDIRDLTVHSLAAFMIDTAEREGFELVTLGACMNDPPENWYRDPTTGGRWRASSNNERDDTQSLQFKQRIKGEQTESETLPLSIVSPTTVGGVTVLAVATSSPSSPSTKLQTKTRQRASSLQAFKDECVESRQEVKATGTNGEDEEDSGATSRVGRFALFATFASFVVGVLILS